MTAPDPLHAPRPTPVMAVLGIAMVLTGGLLVTVGSPTAVTIGLSLFGAGWFITGRQAGMAER